MSSSDGPVWWWTTFAHRLASIHRVPHTKHLWEEQRIGFGRKWDDWKVTRQAGETMCSGKEAKVTRNLIFSFLLWLSLMSFFFFFRDQLDRPSFNCAFSFKNRTKAATLSFARPLSTLTRTALKKLLLSPSMKKNSIRLTNWRQSLKKKEVGYTNPEPNFGVVFVRKWQSHETKRQRDWVGAKRNCCSIVTAGR